MKKSNQQIALSVRQPYAELIITGKKKIEYRSRPTLIRGRIAIYASKTPGPKETFAELGIEPKDLQTGVLIGTVEITGCRKGKKGFEWLLAKPKRYKRPVKPQAHPQPTWFYPNTEKKQKPTGIMKTMNPEEIIRHFHTML
jgi:hypothetical protein